MLGSPQGRIGAFNEADLEKGYELLREHVAFSTNFKTVLQYGLQPMTTSETSLELLDLFLGVARPQLMEGPKDPVLPGSCQNPDVFYLELYFQYPGPGPSRRGLF